jgi:hypothetical protein
MKVFISLPMHGHSEEDIQNTLNSAKIALREDFKGMDVTFLDCTAKIDSKGKNEGLEGLGEAIKRMADADAVAFAPGWETSKGCQVEQDIAVRWDIEQIYL